MITQELEALAVRQTAFLNEIGVDSDLVKKRNLPCYSDCQNLVLAATSQSGREYLLHPDAAAAWTKMHLAASNDDVSLIMISAFRGFDYQADLIRRKIADGHNANDVLTTLAPPGCSEHHSGMACDIGTMGCPPAEEEFETTTAFEWLSLHGADFGFRLSFPRDNQYGYIYEPWHWSYVSLM